MNRNLRFTNMLLNESKFMVKWSLACMFSCRSEISMIGFSIDERWFFLLLRRVQSYGTCPYRGTTPKLRIMAVSCSISRISIISIYLTMGLWMFICIYDFKHIFYKSSDNSRFIWKIYQQPILWLSRDFLSTLHSEMLTQQISLFTWVAYWFTEI